MIGLRCPVKRSPQGFALHAFTLYSEKMAVGPPPAAYRAEAPDTAACGGARLRVQATVIAGVIGTPSSTVSRTSE